jgi:hypothetical protein
VTNEDLVAWSGRFVGENVGAVFELRSQGRVMIVKPLAGPESVCKFRSADELIYSSPYARFVAVERDSADKVVVFDAPCAGLSHLRFVREDRPK